MVERTTSVERTTCPKCSHTRSRGRTIKCLSVFNSGNVFCHHCGYDSAKEKEIRKESCTKPKQELPKTTSEEFRKFFSDRGINHAVITRNKISWNGKEIMFPYIYKKEILNIKYRGLRKSFRQEKGAAKLFYGLDDIQAESEVFIVEGEIDKLSCEMAGYENAISVPDGAPAVTASTYNTKFQFIDDYIDLFAKMKRIYIAVDNDAPGKKLEAELIRRLGPERCYTIEWPQGCKDANDVLVNHGIPGLMASLENPIRVPLEGVFSVEDYHKNVKSLYENGLQGGLSTGWRHMDAHYTVRPGEVTIVTGMPSHGKSTWLTALLVNLATNYEWKISLYSPENLPMERYMAIIASNKVDKPFREGMTQRMTLNELEETLYWMNKYFFFLLPNEDSLGVKDLLQKTRETISRYGVNGLVLDPWNEIDHSRPNGMSETEHISKSLSEIRMFARLYQIHVWIVAHPVKMIKDAKGNYPVPTAYDISGSAHWYNKGDCILSVWRDIGNEKREVEVHVQKVRFREVGKAGEVKFKHDVVTGRYKAPGYFESYSKKT